MQRLKTCCNKLSIKILVRFLSRYIYRDVLQQHEDIGETLAAAPYQLHVLFCYTR